MDWNRFDIAWSYNCVNDTFDIYENPCSRHWKFHVTTYVNLSLKMTKKKESKCVRINYFVIINIREREGQEYKYIAHAITALNLICSFIRFNNLMLITL